MSKAQLKAAQRAEESIAKAEKRLKGFSWFGGSTAKYEDAAEEYDRAAAQYKIAKDCT